MDLRLTPVTADDVAAARELRIRPEQEGVVAPVAPVAPVAESLAEAYASPDAARRG
jgi:diamine N-acetyltransferase